MKCVECDKHPFCNKIENAQQDICQNFIKKPLKTTITRKENLKDEQQK